MAVAKLETSPGRPEGRPQDTGAVPSHVKLTFPLTPLLYTTSYLGNTLECPLASSLGFHPEMV